MILSHGMASSPTVLIFGAWRHRAAGPLSLHFSLMDPMPYARQKAGPRASAQSVERAQGQIDSMVRDTARQTAEVDDHNNFVRDSGDSHSRGGGGGDGGGVAKVEAKVEVEKCQVYFLWHHMLISPLPDFILLP